MSGGPTGTPEYEGKAIAPTVRPGHVAQHVRVLVRRNPTGVEGIYVLGESIHNGLDFRLERAEESVPNDKNTAVIAIEVLQIGPMMDTVM